MAVKLKNLTGPLLLTFGDLIAERVAKWIESVEVLEVVIGLGNATCQRILRFLIRIVLGRGLRIVNRVDRPFDGNLTSARLLDRTRIVQRIVACHDLLGQLNADPLSRIEMPRQVHRRRELRTGIHDCP